MPRRSTHISDDEVTKTAMNAVYGEDKSIGSVMARIAAAPIRQAFVECDAVSAYPAEMTSRRRSTFVPETTSKRHKKARTDSLVPYRVSNNHTDDYQCGVNLTHRSSPDWLVHPENYRCEICGRYCSDTFLQMDNGVNKCGYCRGQY